MALPLGPKHEDVDVCDSLDILQDPDDVLPRILATLATKISSFDDSDFVDTVFLYFVLSRKLFENIMA